MVANLESHTVWPQFKEHLGGHSEEGSEEGLREMIAMGKALHPPNYSIIFVGRKKK
jgi:hypothetical protein